MNWKWEIGATVMPCALIEEAARRARLTQELAWYSVGRVVERIATECSAGVQRAYIVEVGGARCTYAEESLVSDEAYWDQQVSLYEELRKKA